ncbi:MAG: hypothetical protein JWO22_3705 [Frankiales bacterium]|nr:hypothetical protein [Frankiales bacterium]
MIARLRNDPLTPSALVLIGLVVGGFVAIGLAWNIVRLEPLVALQVPALMSGGLGGLALIVAGCGLLHVQVGRRLAALEDESETRALHAVQGLARRLEGEW